MTSSAKLVCLIGPCAGQAFMLGTRSQTIGRTSDADILIDGNDVSRRHAQVEWRGGEFFVTDLGSRNGTLVNGTAITSQPLRIGDRIQIGLSAILVFTRHDELEQRAQRMQKLEGLANLAGGMVHDFRNSLGVIRVNTDLLGAHLRQVLPGDATVSQFLEDIGLAMEAALAVTQRLLYFARRDVAPGVAQIGLRALIEEVAGMVRRSFQGKHSIDLEVVVDERLQVRGRRPELHHALVNLCLNARDAMPRGGRLVISVRPVTLGRTDAAALHLPLEGRYLEMRVADDGIGMDEATLARIFEPFFTTKAPGEGTGLGLSTVFGIVRDHGGCIHVQSRPGAGTAFNILLPDATPDPGRERRGE